MIITLCGSAKFEDAFHSWNERLTLAGHCVFSLAVFPSVKNGNKNWYNDDIKQTLDLAHFHKIDASDAIVVINKDGYIGFSTNREIEWARRKGKVIYYTEGNAGHPVEHLHQMRHRFTETGTLEVLDNGVWVSVPGAARDLLRVVSELLGEYVKDEDRFNISEGEPYGSISTQTGMLAREAVRKFATRR